MSRYIRPRGTLDLFEIDSSIFKKIQTVAYELASQFNYKLIVVPTFESTSLYARSTGETSDIVTKEMYTFDDKGNRSITLRPEGTAGVIRAIIENKLYATSDLPLKYYYFGQFFRYERPQVGRYREFYQFGLEMVGTDSYLDDCETIIFISELLKRLGINDFVIRINTFGNENCRNNFRNIIKDFFKNHIENLCDDCKNRLESNPLRILDCKIDHEYFKTLNVPSTIDSLDEENKENYSQIKNILTNCQINFIEDKYLVRGLDYYTGLIYEIDVKLKDGKTLTIGGGGRYSSLVKELDGPDLNCVGFGLGVNRIALCLKELYDDNYFDETVDYYIIPFDNSCITQALKVAQILRENCKNVVVETHKKSISSMFKYASKHNFKKVIMIGQEELENKTLKIKNLANQNQYFIKIDELEGEING